MLKRNKKLASRLLAALMALACVLTLLPGAAMAAGEDDGGKMVVDKTATLEDDGTYTIELSAYATGQTTTETIKRESRWTSFWCWTSPALWRIP